MKKIKSKPPYLIPNAKPPLKIPEIKDKVRLDVV